MICLVLHGLVRLRWVVAAGMTYALHPAAMHYAGSILSESLFAFLVMAAVTVLGFGIRRDRLSWIMAAGLLTGLAALTRPVAAPFGFLVVAGMWCWRKSIPRPVAMAVLFSVAAIGTMAPWIVRSSRIAGRFVLVTSTGPVNFALAVAPERWNLNDQSSIWQNKPYWQSNPCGRALTEAHTPPESARADETCLHTALSDLRKNPEHYVRNRIGQLRFPLTSFDAATGNATSFGTALRQKAWTVLGMKVALFTLFSLVPLLAGMIGLFVGKRAIEKSLCSALWLFTILIHLPGYVEYRYFFPAVPMLLVTAACAFHWLEDALHPIISTGTIAPASTLVTSDSTIASPLAPIIEVSDPDPCDASGLA